MRYPKKWVEALIEPEKFGEFGTSATLAERQLYSLQKVGALNEIPKAKRLCYCKEHNQFCFVGRKMPDPYSCGRSGEGVPTKKCDLEFYVEDEQ